MLIIKEQEEPDTVSEEQIFIAVTQMNKQHTDEQATHNTHANPYPFPNAIG